MDRCRNFLYTQRRRRKELRKSLENAVRIIKINEIKEKNNEFLGENHRQRYT